MPKTPFERNGKMCEVVRRERQKLGLTQEQLADKIGVQKNTIGLIERDKTGMRKKTADDLMRLFECDDLYLLGESPYKTEEERNEADILDEFDMSVEQREIVTDAISRIFGWEQLGTAGMCFKLQEPPYRLGYMDSFPCCFGVKTKRHIPDGFVYRPQYYIFDTPDGKRAVPFMAYLDFTEKVFSFIYEELNSLTAHVPVVPGWERYVMTNFFGRMADSTIERFFDASSERDFNLSISEWEETIVAVNRQQDNEKKGEEQ